MEEDKYRSTYQSINPNRCVFEKALLTRRCQCANAHFFNLAEREGVGCESNGASKRCQAFLGLLRQKAQFVLKNTPADQPLPHAKLLKIQLGGLTGLSQLLNPDRGDDDGIENIAGLLEAAGSCYGSLEELPFDRLMPAINQTEGRKRKKR